MNPNCEHETTEVLPGVWEHACRLCGKRSYAFGARLYEQCPTKGPLPKPCILLKGGQRREIKARGTGLGDAMAWLLKPYSIPRDQFKRWVCRSCGSADGREKTESVGMAPLGAIRRRWRAAERRLLGRAEANAENSCQRREPSGPIDSVNDLTDALDQRLAGRTIPRTRHDRRRTSDVR